MPSLKSPARRSAVLISIFITAFDLKAVCWMGKEKMSVERVPDPTILNPRDAIIKVTSTAICGSDLHLYNGFRSEGSLLDGQGKNERGKSARSNHSESA